MSNPPPRYVTEFPVSGWQDDFIKWFSPCSFCWSSTFALVKGAIRRSWWYALHLRTLCGYCRISKLFSRLRLSHTLKCTTGKVEVTIQRPGFKSQCFCQVPNLSLCHMTTCFVTVSQHVLTILGKTCQFQMVWPMLAEVYMMKTDQSKNQDIFPFQRFLALSVMQVSKTLSRKPTELVSSESRFWSSQFSDCFRTYPLIDTGNNFNWKTHWTKQAHWFGCQASRDVPDTTLPDTGFNRIVINRIPDIPDTG